MPESLSALLLESFQPFSTGLCTYSSEQKGNISRAVAFLTHTGKMCCSFHEFQAVIPREAIKAAKAAEAFTATSNPRALWDDFATPRADISVPKLKQVIFFGSVHRSTDLIPVHFFYLTRLKRLPHRFRSEQAQTTVATNRHIKGNRKTLFI